ncbi:acyl-CoA N-acyltransferase [Annulohypoxylon maeteangense]|uniref:acyl-CoA N-acyltransferase n=1 Tax=Annulohypoxylon maeteangense TaxID=1927788 RepID=UPI0020083155|nr:acyl-CoA N-acyltransferase [Annulohypoxylon maeteangense]KAI0890669.1 acyl-CoA N-acyltransferase [Annulohypoxylon maeteangense]
MAAKVASPLATPNAPPRLAHEVTIGEALVSEAAAISLIGTTTFTTTFGYSVPENNLATFLEETYSEKAIEAEIISAQESNISTFVARNNTGAVLGFVQLVRELSDPCLEGETSSHAELRRLYVDVSTQGLGVGSKLIAAVEERARVEGFKQLWLTVFEENTRTQRLYERLGFVKKGETDFSTGGCIQTDWVLSKPL